MKNFEFQNIMNQSRFSANASHSTNRIILGEKSARIAVCSKLPVFIKGAYCAVGCCEALSGKRTEEFPEDRTWKPFTPAGKQHAKSAFLVGTWLLLDCRAVLLRGNVEQIGYLTGTIHSDGTRNIERLIKLRSRKASAAYVISDLSSHYALIEMEQRGYRLHACVHTHLEQGIAASLPSPIDLDHQHRLEKAGYQAIGFILSRDKEHPGGAFVRAFSDRLEFEVKIYGKGVSQIEKALFRLSPHNGLSNQEDTS